jgi:hypothetical protein
MRSACLAFVALLLPGCPGSTAVDAGADVPAATDTPAMDVPGTTDAPMGVDAPRADAPAADAAGVTVSIADFNIFGNCMPIVPPDPIVATWTVVVAGASGTSGSFESGTLTFSGGEVVPVTVDVPSFTLTAGGAMQAQRREPGVIKVDGCSLCGMGVRLDATYRVDGASFPVVANGNFSCAF